MTKQRFLYTVSSVYRCPVWNRTLSSPGKRKESRRGDVNKSSVFKLNGDAPQGLSLKTTLYPHVKCMAFRRMNWLKRLV